MGIADTLDEKTEKLKSRMEEYTRGTVLVAFSGGVDSSLLLKLACEAARENRSRVYAVTMQTRLHPVAEIEHAKAVAEEIGAVHMVIPVDELMEAGIRDNPTDRCYRCKRHLFQKIKERAAALGAAHILEGTNADDLNMYRPGLRAIRELDIVSPLADAGIGKAEVRRLAEQFALSVSNRPAMPCLATRFPYGTELTYEELLKVERGEDYVRGFGGQNLRLRVHGNTVRIETDEQDFSLILAHKGKMIEFLKNLGYTYITLDLEGFRSGSMDIE